MDVPCAVTNAVGRSSASSPGSATSGVLSSVTSAIIRTSLPSSNLRAACYLRAVYFPDEFYYNVLVPPEAEVIVHAHVFFADWVNFPMVVTMEGPAGRCAGAGRTAFLANGHSMQSMEPPAIRQLWRNALGWLLGAA